MNPLRLALLAALAVMALLAAPAGDRVGFGPAAAVAQDDDGDDDGDDGGGRGGSRGERGGRSDRGEAVGGRGGPVPRWLRRAVRPRYDRPRRASRPRRPAVVRAAPAVPVRTEAPAEIVALGLSPDDLTVLAGEGYTVLQQDTVVRTGATVVRLGVPAGTTLEAARDRVRAANPAATADFNHLYRPVQAGEAPCETLSCPQAQLVAWPVAPGAAGTCGAGARIGIVDTGINPEHEALSAAALRLLPFDLGRPDAAASGRQHGTAVAALLLAAASTRAPGLLPDAEVYAVDVFFRGGAGGAADDERTDAFSLVRGLDQVSAQPITVLNLSLAGPANEALRAMVEAIVADGIVVVAAVGNDGPQAPPLYPAAYPGVIGVTAVDSGGRAFRRAGRGDHVDLAAPGVEVWTAASISGAKPVTGTSFAAPFVTAAVALVQAGRSLKGHDAVLEALAATAEDLGEPGRDAVYGAGLLRAAGLCVAPA
jgi:hypothetical protein